MTSPTRGRMLVISLAALAAAGGGSVALLYHSLGLTLVHYDARGHLVVARRIFDSITPGWQQIGAVWLPLPHLLNAIPIQIDTFYRTGASAVAISVLSFAVATAAIAWIVATVTGSEWAAVVGACVFALNPNVLYLQSTPMTEPLFIALTLTAVALLMRWCMTPIPFLASLAGWALALACLTRYEAWPIAGSALAIAAWARARTDRLWPTAITGVARIAVYPAGAVAAFFVFSRMVVGAWFVNDFFVPENPATGRPYRALAEIIWGMRELSNYALLIGAAIGGIALVVFVVRQRSESAALLPFALLGGAVVPFVAFLEGHPYRIRYMMPLMAAEAIAAGMTAGLWKRGRTARVVTLACVVAFELHPLNTSAPLVVEAEWDSPNVLTRTNVSDCLAGRYQGETVMASMGSLGHYMQSLSGNGFQLRDFLHEGNGDIWLNALDNPRPFAGWLLIEEKAEGGDMLARRARENPAFLDGFVRVCDAAGVALYQRRPPASVNAGSASSAASGPPVR